LADSTKDKQKRQNRLTLLYKVTYLYSLSRVRVNEKG
jgi:hypothetical protein